MWLEWSHDVTEVQVFERIDFSPFWVSYALMTILFFLCPFLHYKAAKQLKEQGRVLLSEAHVPFSSQEEFCSNQPRSEKFNQKALLGYNPRMTWLQFTAGNNLKCWCYPHTCCGLKAVERLSMEKKWHYANRFAAYSQYTDKTLTAATH